MRRWPSWCSQPRGATRRQRCGGSAGASAVWSVLWPSAASAPARGWSGGCCAAWGFNLQANSKIREGTHHPDRNAQFEYINAQVQAFQAAGQLTISVDTKKELVGDFKNAGRELRPKGQPEPVRVHDCVLPELGKVVPYGVYAIAPTQAGSTSVSPATPQPLPSRAFGASGTSSASPATPGHRDCSEIRRICA